MTKPNDAAPARRETVYRGIRIRTYEVPCTPFVWLHDELDGYGCAPTLEQAKEQIDRHLQLVEQADEERVP